MKFQVALRRILTRLEHDMHIEPEVKDKLEELIAHAPEFDFSVSASREALSSLPGIYIPQGHHELESWLDALADEISRFGTQVHTTCHCGASLENHVASSFMVFVTNYAVSELRSSTIQSFLASITRLHSCLTEFSRFRPSEN